MKQAKKTLKLAYCVSKNDAGNIYDAIAQRGLSGQELQDYIKNYLGYNFDFRSTAWKLLERKLIKGFKEWCRYRAKQADLQQEAIEWQQDVSNNNYSLDVIIDKQHLFQVYGKRYGLIKEFRENGII